MSIVLVEPECQPPGPTVPSPQIMTGRSKAPTSNTPVPKPMSPPHSSHSALEDDSKRARLALNIMQRNVMAAYVNLSQHILFSPSIAFTTENLNEEEYALFRHPLQDPTGCLFVALLSLRTNRPGPNCFLPAPYESQLTQSTRRDAAVRLSLAHKMANHVVGTVELEFVRILMNEFLLSDELPQWYLDWKREGMMLLELESRILIHERIFVLFNENPMVFAATEIEALYVDKKISRLVSFAMKGCLFFLLGTCLLNPTEDVLETLNLAYTPKDVGLAVVSVLLTCHKALNAPRISFRAAYSTNVDLAALVILENACAAHANTLRTGPYSRGGPGLVRSLVSLTTLGHAKAVFEECANMEVT